MKTKIVILAALFTSIAGFSQKQWTLKQCVNHALENNITIKQNKLQIKLAEKDTEIAKGNFLPNLNGSASTNLGFGSTLHPVTRNLVSQNTFGNSYSLNTGVTIFNGFRNLNTLKQAKLGVQARKLEVAKITNDISLNVVNYYLNVLFAKENLKVAKVQSEISKNQTTQATIKFEAGAIPKTDLLNAKATAANDQQKLVLQENTLNLALLNLKQVLQVSSPNFDVAAIKIDAPSAALLYDSAQIVYSKALTNRPEIANAKLNIKNADLSIEMAKGAYLPTLTASANAATNFGHSFDLLPGQKPNTYFFKQLKDNLGYGIGLSLNVPLFNRFQTKNRVAKAAINKEQSTFNLQSKQLQLEQEITTSFLEAKAAAKTFEVAKISLEAQQEAFKNAQVGYNYGSITQFDFDQVRNRLVTAQGVMIRSKYDYVFKTKVLKFYFGEAIVD
ncbi:TolC family protein [Tenacibaculum finnmarkense]|uniref:TolC family protein n=1 Tax=Tenacibaculum finnmarkense TaxID=2781243 RepID=UPI00187B3885|nr:TolC family protein [Tenacibaculum finnmarkense]MBE7633261.1 TolC family protein [Tenacibaculum finnmarkense genomovar ulcerans]MCD8429176.1 TolC family protein [Tenacibaculum finnmarkense genomovar ulcerans]MCG8882077.1 TolC family protein [Tenacibaculum finnmarkense]